MISERGGRVKEEQERSVPMFREQELREFAGCLLLLVFGGPSAQVSNLGKGERMLNECLQQKCCAIVARNHMPCPQAW